MCLALFSCNVGRLGPGVDLDADESGLHALGQQVHEPIVDLARGVPQPPRPTSRFRSLSAPSDGRTSLSNLDRKVGKRGYLLLPALIRSLFSRS